MLVLLYWSGIKLVIIGLKLKVLFSKAFAGNQYLSIILKAIENSKVEALTEKNKHDKVIYRLGSFTLSNLTYRPGIDFDGLSFTLNRPSTSGQVYMSTTIKTVNNQKVILAIQDSSSHVSIKPNTLISSMQSWMDSRQLGENNQHPCTLALRVIVNRFKNP